MSLVMGLVNLVYIPAESDDIVTQVDDSHFSRLAWPTLPAAAGAVGVLSRCWYLPGMYTPAADELSTEVYVH